MQSVTGEVTAVQNSWTHGDSQAAEKGLCHGHPGFSFCLFSHPGSPAQELVLPTVRWVLPPQVNRSENALAGTPKAGLY